MKRKINAGNVGLASLDRFETLTDEELVNISGGDLASIIKQERLKIGFTQEDLAVKLFVSPKTVGNWEQGRCQPDVYAVQDLCHLFSMNMEVFLNKSKE